MASQRTGMASQRTGMASQPGGRTGMASQPGGRTGMASQPGGRTGMASQPGGRTGMASQPGPQPRVLFQTPEASEEEEPPQRRLGKLTVKYNRKDLQRRLDIEEWIDEQLHVLFDCEDEDIPELEIDIDELLDFSDSEQRSKLQELLQECGKPKEDFINGLLYRIKGLRKMSGPLRK